MRLRNHCLKCTHFVEKMYSIFTLIIDKIYIQSMIEEIEAWILIMLQSYIISSVIMISLNEEERILWIQRLREISTVQSAIEHVNVHRIMHASRMHAVEEFSILKHSYQASSRITMMKSKSDMKMLRKKTWIRWQRKTWKRCNQRIRTINDISASYCNTNVSKMHAVKEFSILKHSHQASSRITTTTKSKSDMKTLKKKTWIRWQRETWQSKNQNNRRHQC